MACASALAVAALMIAVPSPASAEPAPPAGVILDTDAHAVVNWSVPDRYQASWDAWRPQNDRYDADFVNPTAWSMTLDGCASTSKYRVVEYAFKLEQLGQSWSRTRTTTACKLVLHDLPAQGYYRATLTLHTQGSFAGVSAPTTRVTAVKDQLIVSLGDSLASGEGNPDVQGAYDVSYNFKGEASASVVKREKWKDRRCHRSARSGPALAAKAFEDADPQSSITFLSLACSGATIANLIHTDYEGIEPVGDTTVPPQIEEIRRLVGISAPHGGRKIDALLISAGINDLHFSDIIERCASNWHGGTNSDECVRAGGISSQLKGLPAKYEALARALRTRLPDTREVYLNDYPANPFKGGACGSLNFNGVGIGSGEAEEMHTWGIALDSKIVKATTAFRSDLYRWNFVPDLSTPFDSHPYCAGFNRYLPAPDAGPSWFRTYEQSFLIQGDKYGTAHPNALGHRAYADLLRRAIVLDQSSRPYRQLAVTIDAVKLPAAKGSPVKSVLFTLYQNQGYHQTLMRSIEVPRSGTWESIPTTSGTFSLDVYPTPAVPRRATGLYLTFDSILGIRGTLQNAYDAGTHTATHPTGALAVRYTVTLKTPPTGPVVDG